MLDNKEVKFEVLKENTIHTINFALDKGDKIALVISCEPKIEMRKSFYSPQMVSRDLLFAR